MMQPGRGAITATGLFWVALALPALPDQLTRPVVLGELEAASHQV